MRLRDQLPVPSSRGALEGVPAALLRTMYAKMLTIRQVEDKVGDLVARGEIICPCHLYTGQEAVATGVCSALRVDDWVLSTHRSHGHYIAKGGDINSLMAELYGRVTGCSRGRGGSMHLASPEIGLPGSSAIVAGTIPIAVGAALSFSMQRSDAVSVAFFGDGAVGEGAFYESLNFASLRKLPVVFVCENNLYSTHMPIATCLVATAIHSKAALFGMPGVVVDGNDVVAVHRTATEAVRKARSGDGPTLMECLTYRWCGHVGPNDDLDKGLRSKEELQYWKDRCPIERIERVMVGAGLARQSEFDCIRAEVSKAVDRALAFAKESPYPSESDLLRHVFKSQDGPGTGGAQ